MSYATFYYSTCLLVSIDLVFDVTEGSNCQRDPPPTEKPAMEESRPSSGQTIWPCFWIISAVVLFRLIF